MAVDCRLPDHPTLGCTIKRHKYVFSTYAFSTGFPIDRLSIAFLFEPAESEADGHPALCIGNHLCGPGSQLVGGDRVNRGTGCHGCTHRTPGLQLFESRDFCDIRGHPHQRDPGHGTFPEADSSPGRLHRTPRPGRNPGSDWRERRNRAEPQKSWCIPHPRAGQWSALRERSDSAVQTRWTSTRYRLR